jgi:hypothetical protein
VSNLNGIESNIIFITLVYASVSFFRIYYLRRLFVRFGWDDNVISLGMKLYHKVLHKNVKSDDK